MSPVGDYIVITGMSGAGRSTAGSAFEDLGYDVIDNVPPALMVQVAEVLEHSQGSGPRVAFVVGRGGPESVKELVPALQELGRGARKVRILFLDASDEELVKRFEGTRRRHPVEGASVAASIAQERQELQKVKQLADVVLDTGDLNTNQLRARIMELFGNTSGAMHTSVVSFGFKHGIPVDSDLVLDCRFIPNPHWVPELAPLTGLDEPVRDYVLSQSETVDFLDRLTNLFELVLPAYRREGKSYLSVAVGCTGGQHRSVVIAEELVKRFERLGFEAEVFHRDVARP
jgi:UPF0042 nucleotide-binding protein